MTYDDYIASPMWQRLRAEALERDGHSCRLCDSSVALEVHHRRYPTQGRWDLDSTEHLTTLCADCHGAVTCRQRDRRYGSIPIIAADITRVTPTAEVHREQLQDPEIQDHRRLSPVTVMKNGQTVDPLNAHSRSIAEITSKRKKTDGDHREIGRREFMAGLYLMNGEPCLPGEMMEAALIRGAIGAIKEKRGPAAKAGIIVEHDSRLEYDGPHGPDDL